MFLEKQKIIHLHIPKTGGTSIEHYFIDKYNLPLNHDFSKSIDVNKKTYLLAGPNKNDSILHSYHHMTLREIMKCKNINIKKLKLYKIICVVRNPYERLISDLCYLKLLNEENKNDLLNIINNYLNNKKTSYDNHRIPQYKYLEIDDFIYQGDNLNIIKFENLNFEMKLLGFQDFNIHANKSIYADYNFSNLLTSEIKNIIYNYYKKDFELFGYMN
jgi:hypothetical protein